MENPEKPNKDLKQDFNAKDIPSPPPPPPPRIIREGVKILTSGESQEVWDKHLKNQP